MTLLGNAGAVGLSWRRMRAVSRFVAMAQPWGVEGVRPFDTPTCAEGSLRNWRRHWHNSIRLRRMHEMQTIVTDDRGVCLYVCQSVCYAVQLGAACSVCGVIRRKFLWLLVNLNKHLLFAV